MPTPVRPLVVMLVILSAGCLTAMLTLALPAEAAGTNTLHLPSVNVAPNQEITVTLALTYGQGSIISADIRVVYDPALLTAVRVTKGSAVGGANWSLFSNLTTAGLVQAGLATGSTPLTASGDLLYLTFRAGSQIAASPLTLTQGSLNEGDVAAVVQSGSVNVNTAPVARTDGYTTQEDQRLTVAAAGILSNDSDGDGHTLAASINTGPSHGQLSLAASGAFVYTPTLDYFGADAFVYNITDGHNGSATATVNITITAVNDLPVARAGGPYTVNEGSSVALNGGASSDVEDSTGSLTFEWDLDSNGSFEASGITPSFSAVGKDGPTTVSARLRVRDTQAGVSLVNTATVSIQNVAPTANPGGPYTAAAESSIQLNGAGSSDPGGANDPLTYAWDWGNDGSTDATIVQPTFSTAGLEDTTVQVGLRVTDDEGAVSTNVTTTVRVQPLPRWNVTGQVAFWRDGAPLPNVRLTLQGFRTISATNQSNGGFTLSSVPQGSYSLTPAKTDQVNGITAYDAALTLRHVSGVAALNGYAALAADVNQQAGISSLDASLILQKAVNSIAVPFPGASATWVYSPTQYAYATLNSNKSSQNFSGLLLGDVSGNWGADAMRTMSGAATDFLLLETSPVDEQGDLAVVVWLVKAIPDLFAIETGLTYESTSVSLIDVDVAPPLADWIAMANTAQPGQIVVAAAGTTGLPVGSRLFSVRVNVRDCQSDCGLSIAGLMLNEQVIAPEVGAMRSFLPVVSR